MSIASELTALQGHMNDAFDAVEEMGGTLPETVCMSELTDAILSIPTGSGSVSYSFVTNINGAFERIINPGECVTFGVARGTSRYYAALTITNAATGATESTEFWMDSSKYTGYNNPQFGNVSVCIPNNKDHALKVRVTVGDSNISVRGAVIKAVTS